MAILDSFSKVNDGDQLNDGYFNGMMNTAILKSLCAASGATGFKEPVNAIATNFNTESLNTVTSTTQCLWSNGTKEYIAGGTVFDNFDNSSVDATKWSTSGTVTEDTESMSIGNTSYATSNGASGLNMNSGVTYVLIDANGGGSPNNSYIAITNGTTTVTVYNSIPTTRVAMLLKVDASNNLADLWYRSAVGTWSSLASSINISTVTTNKYLRLGVGVNGSINAYKICNYSTDATSDLVTSTKTVSSTTKAGIFWEGTGTITGYLSLDGGSNYTTVDSGLMATMTAGTSLKAKLTLKTNNSNSPDSVSMIGCQTW